MPMISSMSELTIRIVIPCVGQRRPCAGRSRPWRRRRCRASARRGSAPWASSPATCRARPSAGCRPTGSPTFWRMLGVLVRRRVDLGLGDRALGARDRASPSGRSCRCRAATCSGRRSSAGPARGACGPRGRGRRRASMASAGGAGANGWPSSVIDAAERRRRRRRSPASARCGPRRPARRTRGSRPAGREADAGGRAGHEQVVHLQHRLARRRRAASAGNSCAQSSRPTIIATILSCVASARDRSPT